MRERVPRYKAMVAADIKLAIYRAVWANARVVKIANVGGLKIGARRKSDDCALA